MHSVLCIAYKYSTYLEITLLFGCSYAFCCFDGKCASENAFCFPAMQSKEGRFVHIGMHISWHTHHDVQRKKIHENQTVRNKTIISSCLR